MKVLCRDDRTGVTFVGVSLARVLGEWTVGDGASGVCP